MQIKKRKSDIEFSLYLRKKRKYPCEYDGVFFTEGKGLTVSHFYGRRKESLRFSGANCDVPCSRHHQNFEENSNEYVAWKKIRMGEQEFEKLAIAAEMYQKRDDKRDLLAIRALAKELERQS
jgi:hypothetical protein